MDTPVDCAIVGGGISGTALAYVLAGYSGMRRIAIIESAPVVGCGNSAPTANSQTLHRGDIEAWYTPEDAVRIRDASAYTVAYLEQRPNSLIWKRIPTMLLAVGDREIAALEDRFWVLRQAFPELQLLTASDIAAREPAILRGRASGERIAALAGTPGYAVDFRACAQQLLRDAARARSTKVVVRCGYRVERIARVTDGGFTITTTTECITAAMVAVCAGGFGLQFAHGLGIGTEYAVLPIEGSFATVHRGVLRGKVYTMQERGIPFTRPHADADVSEAYTVRFGPTVMPVPFLDRRGLGSMLAFVRQLRRPLRALAAFATVLTRGPVVRYAASCALAALPFVGRWFFARMCRRIVPAIVARELAFTPRRGGIRPQLVDLRTRRMVSSDARITGDGILVRVAPSPGASTCLATALEDAAYCCAHLGVALDRERFVADHTPRRAGVPVDIAPLAKVFGDP